MKSSYLRQLAESPVDSNRELYTCTVSEAAFVFVNILVCSQLSLLVSLHVTSTLCMFVLLESADDQRSTINPRHAVTWLADQHLILHWYFIIERHCRVFRFSSSL